MTAPHDALTLSVNFNDGTGIVALQMTYTWVGPGFGESLPAPVATLAAPAGVTLWRVNYATNEAAPADAYGGQFYLRQGTGDPAAPTWGPWILWVEEPASAWSGGFRSTLTVPAALTPPDTLLEVDPPLRDQYQSVCVDCVDSGPILVSRSGGTPSWARYLVAYTWLNAAGDETRAQTVALDSASMHGGTAASTSTWQPREKHFNIIPAGAAMARWYVNPPTDPADPSSSLAGWLHATDVPVVAGTLADWTLAVADAGAWPAAALPALNATCRAGWLRLSHASGQSYIQQNGRQVQVRAGELDVLDLPLPVLAAAPATLVGQDPASGLPAFCPAPKPSPAQLLTPPPPPPSTTLNCVQVRCSAAGEMTNHLISLYGQWATWLDPFFNVLGTAAAGLLIGLLLDPLFIGPEAVFLGADALAIYQALKPLLEALLGNIPGGLLPSPTPDQTDAVRKACFCQLTCDGNVVNPTPEQVAAWRSAVGALTIFDLATLTGPLLLLLLQFTPLQNWQIAVQSATTDSYCDAWTCP